MGSDLAPDEPEGGDSSQVQRAARDVDPIERPVKATAAPPARGRAMPAPRTPKNLEGVPDELAGAVVEADPSLESGERISFELDGRPSLPPVSLPPPMGKLGRYEVLGRLATGGMAEIFLGQEMISGGGARAVTIKVLRQHLLDDEDFEAMFLREGRVAMQLSHPHICTVYDFGKWGGHYYIAMEYVDGATLKELLHRAATERAPLPLPAAASIIASIASALHYAHTMRDARRKRLGVIHRDVSPQNIMVRFDGVVKLLDFGVAKVQQQEEETRSDAVKGKFAYLAPEQCVAGEVDARTDVFSLGICLFEALTGRRLYRRDSQYETFHAIVAEPVPSLRELDESFPVELDAIVQKALAKDKAERFQTAGELGQALEEWIAHEGEVVNAARLETLMQRLFATRIEAGPPIETGDDVASRLAPIAEHAPISSRPPPAELDLPAVALPPNPATGALDAAISSEAPTAFEASTSFEASTALAAPSPPAQRALRPAWIAVAVAIAIAAGLGLYLSSAEPAAPAAHTPPTGGADREARNVAEATTVVPEPVSLPPAAEPANAMPASTGTARTGAADENEPSVEAEQPAPATPEMSTRSKRPRRHGGMRPGFVNNPGF